MPGRTPRTIPAPNVDTTVSLIILAAISPSDLPTWLVDHLPGSFHPDFTHP